MSLGNSLMRVSLAGHGGGLSSYRFSRFNRVHGGNSVIIRSQRNKIKLAKPVIICNTGPLIALERVGLLHLPGTLYGSVLIPDTVEREFLAGETVGTSFDESVNQPLTAMREHGYRIHDKIAQAARQQANE